MESYNTNHRWGTHVVKMTFQAGGYKGSAIAEMGGNCKGASLLSTILDSIEDGDFEPNMNYEENQNHLDVDEDGYMIGLQLIKDGEVLYIDEGFDEYLVAVEIIEFKPENRPGY